MIKIKKISQIVLLSALLAGCQANNEAETEQETTETEETTEVVETETSEEEEEEVSKEEYIEIYQPALDMVADKDNEENPDYFTFYDVNEDGTAEFITASESGEPDVLFVEEAFYLKDGETPELIGETYYPPVGSGRLFINIYDDGTFMNAEIAGGPGEGKAKLYEIAEDQSELVLVDEAEWMLADGENELMEGREALDLNELEWYDFEEMLIDEETDESQSEDVPFYEQGGSQEATEETVEEAPEEETTETPAPASTSMDVNAIGQGDFSSVAGTWRNGVGHEMTFDANGLVSDDSRITTYSTEGPTAYAGVAYANDMGGHSLRFLPAGQTNDPVDSSDSSRDRIWAGQAISDDVNRDYYYKIN